MLDDESTDTPAQAGQEPAKKAPRKRATRAAAAPAPGEPAPPAEDGGGEEAKPPAKKAARKAPAKKAAAKKTAGKQVAEAATEPAEEALGRAEQDEAEAEQAQDAVPAAAAEALTEAAEAEEAEGPSGEQPAEPASRRRARAPMVVTFQAPPSTQEPAPRTRRRAGTSGAVSPDELLPQAEEGPGEDADEIEEDLAGTAARRRRRGRRGRGGAGRALAGEDTADEAAEDGADETEDTGDDEASDDAAEGSSAGTRRRRRRRRSGSGGADEAGSDGDGDGVPTVVHVREPRQRKRRDGGGEADEDGVRGITGSTRMAAKRVRRQEGRDSGRKRAPILTEAEFLARRESVDRQMVVRQKGDRTQIAVLEDGILVEHYVAKASATSYAGNVYLGKVQNVLPSMEAAFVDIGKGRNAVLYAGEVNWEGVAGGQRKIEQALKSGQEVLVQVTKDPIGHKGARLTSQISLPGRYLVYVPEGSMTGISRKLPENERTRLKNILRNVVPEGAGVIIRTAAEGASEEEIAKDVRRLQAQWEVIKEKAAKGGAPKVLHAEPDLVIKVVRDIFNEDFNGLVVQGDRDWETIREYVEFVAPDLAPRLKRHTGDGDVFAEHRVDEQLLKALDRKVYLPSGGSLVIDRTEAMVVIDVNTGKYVGKGGNLEETVTRNNLEAAEEIARQLRLRDLGGIIVVDFIDMVLESNRDLVVRRLVECLGRDRTKHQVAEVTSLGLVQMTRKRVGQGLLESFSETCEHCNGRGLKVHLDPVEPKPERDRDRAPKVGAKAPVPAGSAPDAGTGAGDGEGAGSGRSRRRRGGRAQGAGEPGGESLGETAGAVVASGAAEETLESATGGDVEETPGVTDPAASADVVTADAEPSGRNGEPAAVPAEPAAVTPEPAAVPFDLADQPPTSLEDLASADVVTADAEPSGRSDGGSDEGGDGETPASAVPQEPVKKRRRAAGRPAGAPTV